MTLPDRQRLVLHGQRLGGAVAASWRLQVAVVTLAAAAVVPLFALFPFGQNQAGLQLSLVQGLLAVMAIVFSISLTAGQLGSGTRAGALDACFSPPTLLYMLVFLGSVLVDLAALDDRGQWAARVSVGLLVLCLGLLPVYVRELRRRLSLPDLVVALSPRLTSGAPGRRRSAVARASQLAEVALDRDDHKSLAGFCGLLVRAARDPELVDAVLRELDQLAGGALGKDPVSAVRVAEALGEVARRADDAEARRTAAGLLRTLVQTHLGDRDTEARELADLARCLASTAATHPVLEDGLAAVWRAEALVRSVLDESLRAGLHLPLDALLELLLRLQTERDWSALPSAVRDELHRGLAGDVARVAVVPGYVPGRTTISAIIGVLGEERLRGREVAVHLRGVALLVEACVRAGEAHLGALLLQRVLSPGAVASLDEGGARHLTAVLGETVGTCERHDAGEPAFAAAALAVQVALRRGKPVDVRRFCDAAVRAYGRVDPVQGSQLPDAWTEVLRTATGSCSRPGAARGDRGLEIVLDTTSRLALTDRLRGVSTGTSCVRPLVRGLYQLLLAGETEEGTPLEVLLPLGSTALGLCALDAADPVLHRHLHLLRSWFRSGHLAELRGGADWTSVRAPLRALQAGHDRLVEHGRPDVAASLGMNVAELLAGHVVPRLAADPRRGVECGEARVATAAWLQRALAAVRAAERSDVPRRLTFTASNLFGLVRRVRTAVLAEPRALPGVALALYELSAWAGEAPPAERTSRQRLVRQALAALPHDEEQDPTGALQALVSAGTACLLTSGPSARATAARRLLEVCGQRGPLPRVERDVAGRFCDLVADLVDLLRRDGLADVAAPVACSAGWQAHRWGMHPAAVRLFASWAQALADLPATARGSEDWHTRVDGVLAEGLAAARPALDEVRVLAALLALDDREVGGPLEQAPPSPAASRARRRVRLLWRALRQRDEMSGAHAATSVAVALVWGPVVGNGPQTVSRGGAGEFVSSVLEARPSPEVAALLGRLTDSDRRRLVEFADRTVDDTRRRCLSQGLAPADARDEVVSVLLNVHRLRLRLGVDHGLEQSRERLCGALADGVAQAPDSRHYADTLLRRMFDETLQLLDPQRRPLAFDLLVAQLRPVVDACLVAGHVWRATDWRRWLDELEPTAPPGAAAVHDLLLLWDPWRAPCPPAVPAPERPGLPRQSRPDADPALVDA